MSIKCKVIQGFVAIVVTMLLSCGGKGGDTSQDEVDLLLTDSIPVDTLAQEEEELSITEENTPQFDGIFNDFLFAYLHSRTLRQERTTRPLPLEHSQRPTELLEDFNPEFELSFLTGEYFTTLYGGASQMQAEDDEELEEDSVVSLQRINLNDGTIRNYRFLREEGRWQLAAIREETFDDDDLSDFLGFYARFCSDSIFQSQSIADPLHISIQESEDEDETINGIIDADQWQTFCPEVPSGIICNIRKGQSYSGHRIVMRKSGLSNGLQEIFTFSKERNGWKLIRYEN
ncbi:MAG: DUF4348 domain-containing protein [Bacteroidaceae bacterium]|nr:DUF4348 domain-containing protein [Bacteroidaceae bacterium]